LFERLMLEINQAGLSWLTILKKKDAFRRAYAGFDPGVVAAYGPREVRRLLADAGIIRNRLKVEAAIANARAVLELRESHGSFAKWLEAHLWLDAKTQGREGARAEGDARTQGRKTDAKTQGRKDAKEARHPRRRTKEEWVQLFKQTFRFTGGEIVGEFLISSGYLPGAHRESCPVYPRVLAKRPAWARAL
jgi:DNA-3-methyladenine glycosylase I